MVAEAISTLLEADPQTSVRAALGDLDEFREAVDCLDAYRAVSARPFRSARDQYATPIVGVVCREERHEGQSASGDHHRRWAGNHQDIACVERHDLTPETFGLSLAEGKAVLQALQEVVVEWQMHTYLQAATHLSTVWEDAPPQRHASYGVSDDLWDPPGRESSTLSLSVSGPAHDHVQSPGDPASRTYDPGTAVSGNQMGGFGVLWPDRSSSSRMSCPSMSLSTP